MREGSNRKWPEYAIVPVRIVPVRVGCPEGWSSRFRRKLFHGRRYLAQTGRTSRTAPRETATGHRDRLRGANLRPKPLPPSHRELVSGPFRHSKYPEADRSLLARTPEFRKHSHQAQRRYVQGVTAAF